MPGVCIAPGRKRDSRSFSTPVMLPSSPASSMRSSERQIVFESRRIPADYTGESFGSELSQRTPGTYSGCNRLAGPAPGQAPQAAHREDDGEERGHAHREECPNEEQAVTAVGPEADSHASHVDHRDAHQQERRDEDDDIPRSLFGEHERSV